MPQFPAVLIPPQVQRIALSKPPAPEFRDNFPRSPAIAHPEIINIQEALYQTMGLIVVVALVTIVAKELGITLLIVGSIYIVFQIRYQFQTYKIRCQKHQVALERYLASLESYSREEIKYQQKLAIAHSPDRLLEFRQQQFRSFFKKIPAINNGLALTSNSSSNVFDNLHKNNLHKNNEQANDEIIYSFGIELQKHFSGIIYQGVSLSIASIDCEWCPSLTYIDPDLNLHIAIEIISPLKNDANVMRNDLAARFLVDSGWIIISFLEEQILQNSAECCKEFAKLLDRLSLDQTVLSNFADIPELD